MKWRRPSEKLIKFLEDNLKKVDCEHKKLFGCPAYFINNNMFIGAFGNDLFLRLSPDDRMRALERYSGIKSFEPRPGMILKEYVLLPEKLYRNKKIFSKLLAKSIKYVSSLSSKTKKKKT